MDDAELTELRKLAGQHAKLVYDAVKTGTVDELPHESQLHAEAIREHMHLKHIHNALEFADVREGEQYEITLEGETVNPIAHIAAHSGVKGQLEEDPLVRAAFEKLVASGASAHHAEHIPAAILFETQWEITQAIDAGMDPRKARTIYDRKIQKLIRDPAYRKKFKREISADHAAFE
jgi:hypothetical protein